MYVNYNRGANNQVHLFGVSDELTNCDLHTKELYKLTFSFPSEEDCSSHTFPQLPTVNMNIKDLNSFTSIAIGILLQITNKQRLRLIIHKINRVGAQNSEQQLTGTRSGYLATMSRDSSIL